MTNANQAKHDKTFFYKILYLNNLKYTVRTFNYTGFRQPLQCAENTVQMQLSTQTKVAISHTVVSTKKHTHTKKKHL